MKKILILGLLLFLTACGQTAERKLHEAECEKVTYCNEWLQTVSKDSYTDTELNSEITDKLSYFGSTMKDIQLSFEEREDVVDDYSSLDELKRLEAITYYLLPDEEEAYDINVEWYDGFYIVVEVYEHGPFLQIDDYTEHHASTKAMEMSNLLYNELNFFFDEDVKIEYTIVAQEEYLDGKINYEIEVDYSGEHYGYHSNDEFMRWEYVRVKLLESLDFNLFMRLDPLRTDPNNPTVARNRLVGRTLDEIFLATGDESYEDKAFEVYNDVRNFVTGIGFPFEEMDIQITVQKEYFVLDVMIDDDQTNQQVEYYQVPLEQYFNRKFNQIIDRNFIENETFNNKELYIEFLDNNEIYVEVYTSDTEAKYTSFDEIDVDVHQMIDELKLEFEKHGYHATTINYHFKVALKQNDEVIIIDTKHVNSTDPIQRVDWYDYYIENLEE